MPVFSSGFRVLSAALPSYTIQLSAVEAGGGGPGTITYTNVVIPTSDRVVVVVISQDPFSITSVTWNSIGLTLDAGLRGNSGVWVWSATTASLGGPGTHDLVVQCSGGFPTVSTSVFALSNVSSVMSTLTNSASSTSPWTIGTLSPNSNDLIFGGATGDGGSGTPTLASSTEAPHEAGAKTFSGYVIGDMQAILTQTDTFIMSGFTATQAVCGAFVRYR